MCRFKIKKTYFHSDRLTINDTPYSCLPYLSNQQIKCVFSYPWYFYLAFRSSYGCCILENRINGWVIFTIEPVLNNIQTFHVPVNISKSVFVFRTLWDAFFNLLKHSFFKFIFIYLCIYFKEGGCYSHSQPLLSLGLGPARIQQLRPSRS